MSVKRLIIWLLVSFIIIGNAVKFEFDLIGAIISVFNIIMIFYYFHLRISFFQRLASTCLFIYIFLSLNLYAFGDFIGLMGELYSLQQRRALAIFGNNVMLCFLIGLFISLPKYNRKIQNSDIDEYINPPIRSSKVYAFITLSFILSFISYFLGIGRMGAEGVQLPFKLNGIIQMFRTDIVPIVFMVIVARNYRDKRIKRYICLFFLYALVETFVMLSKSRLVFVFLPIVLYYILKERRIDKRIIKALTPVIIVFFLLYPIIGAMRYIKTDSLLSFESIKQSKELSDEIERTGSNNGIQIQFYNRSFLAGQHYMNAYPIIMGEDLFNFARAPIIIIMGGSAAYETHIIEQFPETAIHSSGTTGITDALLLGGHGLAYLTVFIFTLLASSIDKNRLNKQLVLKVFFLLLFIEFIRGKSYSTFIDALLIPFMVCKMLEYLLIKKSYTKKPKV